MLGNVGMYLGALRRHELTNPAREDRSPFPEASSLAVHCGASLGMAPRFATAHLTIHNRARAGVRKSFTSLEDESLFIDENTRGILLLQRAADALTSIVHLGVSSPAADVMFEAAKFVFAVYVSSFNPGSLYAGTVAAIVVVVFWVDYAALIFILGGEVGQVFELRRTRKRQREVFQD